MGRGTRGEQVASVTGLLDHEEEGRPQRVGTAAWARGGMAPVRPVATVLQSEFSGKVRKIPVDPDWIRKNPVHSGRSAFGSNG